MHGGELPKFSENLKEYWKFDTPRNCNGSFRNIKICKNDYIKNAPEKPVEYSSRKLPSSRKYEVAPKPNEVEHMSCTPSKDFMKDSRWTNYHSNFMQKYTSVDKPEYSSFTPDIKKRSTSSKTPKNLIIKRMLQKGAYSPVKDQFMSTGFN